MTGYSLIHRVVVGVIIPKSVIRLTVSCRYQIFSLHRTEYIISDHIIFPKYHRVYSKDEKILTPLLNVLTNEQI